MAARILVVDDNLVNSKLACDLLTMEGHEPRACGDAREVLEALAEGYRPDLILMDIGLPGMDGLELTRRLRAMPGFAELPIVALTAFAMKADEARAKAAGCTGYIAKPIDTRRLPQQVAGYLSQAAVARPALSIMVVEDHRIDLKLAGEGARLSGHLVLSNTNAEDALVALEAKQPDVVLLDLNLPGMDGLSFLRRVKADPRTRELPVVAITAFPDEFMRAELLAAGCTAYLTKPVDMAGLMRVLEQAAR